MPPAHTPPIAAKSGTDPALPLWPVTTLEHTRQRLLKAGREDEATHAAALYAKDAEAWAQSPVRAWHPAVRLDQDDLPALRFVACTPAMDVLAAVERLGDTDTDDRPQELARCIAVGLIITLHETEPGLDGAGTFSIYRSARPTAPGTPLGRLITDKAPPGDPNPGYKIVEVQDDSGPWLQLIVRVSPAGDVRFATELLCSEPTARPPAPAVNRRLLRSRARDGTGRTDRLV